jgi:hypothetical protein
MDQADLTVRFAVHVHTKGLLAFRVSSEYYPVDRAGMYVGSVKIPSNILAETIYSLNVEAIIVRDGVEKFVLAAFNALSFQVFDPSTSRRDKIGGVVSPAVEWGFEHQPLATMEPSPPAKSR